MKSHGTCITAVLLYFCLSAFGSGDEAVSVRSPSRRFLVTCPEGGQSISVARWADDVLNKLERATRIRLDFKNRDFRIKVFAGPDTSTGRVGCSERFSAGKLFQTLLIESPGKVDWEDILELNCGMLLNGQIATGALSQHQRAAGTVPAWLVVGLSHYIDPVLKSRDRRIVRSWEKRGRVPGISEVLKWHILPVGRSREKAVCTVVVAWLLSLPDAEDRFAKIQERLAVDGMISAEWIVSQIPDCKTVDDVQKLWLNRIGSERMVISDPGQVFPDSLELIKDELVIRPGEGCVPSVTNLSPVITLDALIDMKNLEWIRPLCRAKSAAIKMASVGGSAEVREVGEAYCAFMDVLGESGRASKLRSLLARANAMVQTLEAITIKREEYVDDMERRQAAVDPLLKTEHNLSPDRLERSRLQKYIDDADQSQGERR